MTAPPPARPGPGGPPGERASGLLRVAAAVAVVEALVMTVFAVVVVVEALRGDRSSVLSAVLLGVLLLLWAAGLVVAARGLRARRRWARAPLVLSQVLLLVVGIPLAQGGRSWWAGIVLVVLSVTGLVSVLSRTVTTALGEADGSR